MSVKYPDLPLTKFPDDLDNFAQFVNITTSDAPLVKQYQEAMQNGNFTEASNILNQIPNASTKIVSSVNFNQMLQALTAAQQFFLTDIRPYITEKQQEWSEQVNQFSYKGSYNSSTQYEETNFVLFNDNGLLKIYICIQTPPTSGLNPYNTTYWRELTIRGAQGVSGEGSTFAFEWDSSVDYAAQTIVVSNNAWWYAVQANRNQEPFEGSEYWELVLNITQALYPVQAAQPTSQNTGELWFKVL